MIKNTAAILILTAILLPGINLFCQEKNVEPANQLIIWSSGDREVALKLVLMYSHYSKTKKWMDNVRLLVWGPSAKLLSEDKELQEKVKGLKKDGVELYACKMCADMYGVSKKLESMGITVMYTGKMLADLQKQGWHVITF